MCGVEPAHTKANHVRGWRCWSERHGYGYGCAVADHGWWWRGHAAWPRELVGHAGGAPEAEPESVEVRFESFAKVDYLCGPEKIQFHRALPDHPHWRTRRLTPDDGRYYSES